jgi:hypothetical protein
MADRAELSEGEQRDDPGTRPTLVFAFGLAAALLFPLAIFLSPVALALAYRLRARARRGRALPARVYWGAGLALLGLVLFSLAVGLSEPVEENSHQRPSPVPAATRPAPKTRVKHEPAATRPAPKARVKREPAAPPPKPEKKGGGQSDPAVKAQRFFVHSDDDAIALDAAIGRVSDGRASATRDISRIRKQVLKRNNDRLLEGEDTSVGGNLLLSAATTARNAAQSGDLAGLAATRREITAARQRLAEELRG